MAITHRASFTTDTEESMEFSVPCSPPPRNIKKATRNLKKWSARLSCSSKTAECEDVLQLDFDLKEESEQDADLYELIEYKPWISEDRAKYDDELVYWYAKNQPKSFRVRYDFKKNGKNDQFPLQQVVALGATLRTVEAVVSAYPPALLYRHHVHRSTPLHSACSYPSFFQAGVIEFLLDLNPSAIEETNKNAFLPIHNACCASIPSPIGLEGIQLLVEAYPGSVLKTNKLGETPLQAAKKNPDSLPDVICYLEEIQDQQPE